MPDNSETKLEREIEAEKKKIKELRYIIPSSICPDFIRGEISKIEKRIAVLESLKK